jgi:hypothetical protein
MKPIKRTSLDTHHMTIPIGPCSMTTKLRLFAGCTALLGGFALALQLVLTIRLMLARGQGVWDGVWLYLGFFTVLTNALAVLVLTAVARQARGAVGRRLQRPGVQSMTAMSIVVVGAVYSLLLRQLAHPQGWHLVTDVILHDAMPLLFLLYWWLAVPKADLRWGQIFAWQLYPAGYLAYALARGAADGWYPYPFIDVSTLGYARTLVNAGAVLLGFIAVALLLVALGRWQVRRISRNAALPVSS